MLFGAPHKGSTYSIDLANLFLSELTITSSYAATDSEMAQALELIRSRKIEVKKFVTATYPLSKIDEGFSAARSENHVKIVITK